MKGWIDALVNYALDKGLIQEGDETYVFNRILEILGLDEPGEGEAVEASLPEILNALTDDAVRRGLLDDNITARDLFDTRLMGALTPRPSDVIAEFEALKAESPVKATDYFYGLGVSSNYIRSERTAKNICWKTSTDFGELDITINMSKPEKDPRDIAKAKTIKSTGYPKCLLCRENEGFYGHHGHPARQNIRLIPLTLQGKCWYFQYSPYSYYNEHCIVLDENHVPMLISRETFGNLFAFVEMFPHYFVGSNADLPIVGGSILSHDHYQGGRYTFAMAVASVEKEYATSSPEIKAGRVKWPMSAIRLSSRNPEALVNLADRVLSAWREWTDESVGILAYSDGEPHNTITPIARRRGEDYELDLVLRNNRTSEEHPLGIFHPHAEVHHIKKENIGLIEVMGLAVLPARLKGALEKICGEWLSGKESLPSELEAHDVWYRGLRKKYEGLTGESEVRQMLRDEVGHVFAQVLTDSGVYKRDAQGIAAFDKFITNVLA